MYGDSRSRGDILLLFDVDGTVTPARQCITNEMDAFLQELKQRVTVGLVGGSDLNKIVEQTVPMSLKRQLCDKTPLELCLNRYDYVFAENGLVAYKSANLIAKQNLVAHLGEEKLQKFINFCLYHMSSLQLPVKRGNFIEFRNGLINVCPVGRSCSQAEREQFNAFDKENRIREKFIELLNSKFGPQSDDPLGLVFTIGGQISFDAFPKGWDKTYCLNLIDGNYKEIHFFGDKTHIGGNDYEIFSDSRTIGHSVVSPEDTIEQLKNLNI